MAASDYGPIFSKIRLHFAGRPQMSTRRDGAGDVQREQAGRTKAETHLAGRALRPVLARRTKADASPEPPPAKPHAGSDAVFANRQLHVLRTTGNEAALWLHPRGNRDLVERHRQERAPRERIEKPIRGKSRSFAFAKMTLAR